MAMDWANERYVRLYTRDTEDDLLLSWEATALWRALLRKVDRAGVIEAKRGAKSLALVTKIPVEVVERVLSELLEDGRVAVHEIGFVIPNFIEAQETPQSDRQRKAESRARRRDRGSHTESHEVTSGHAGSRDAGTMGHAESRGVTNRDSNVTNRDQDVTPGHTRSHAVTLTQTEPDQTRPEEEGECQKPAAGAASSPSPPARRPSRSAGKSPSAVDRDASMAVLRKLGEQTGVEYRGSDKHTRLIVGRYREGLTEIDLRKVIAYVARTPQEGGLGWTSDEKMRAYLRPETLFGPETIERYLDAARSWFANRLGGREPEPSPEYAAWRAANEPQPRLAVVK